MLWFSVRALFAVTLSWAGNFAACTGGHYLNVTDHAAADTCTLHHFNATKISIVANHLQEDDDLGKLNALLRPQIMDVLDRSIQARQKMIDCLDQPAKPYCAVKLPKFRGQIAGGVRKLRRALSLAELPEVSAIGDNLSVINQNPKSPPWLGGQRFAKLEPREIEGLKAARDLILANHNNFVGKDDSGKEFSRQSDFEDFCRQNSPNSECERYQGFKKELRAKFRDQAMAVATQTVSNFPLIAHFSTEKPTDAELRSVLVKAKSSLVEWRESLGSSKDIDELMMMFPERTDEILKINPQWCQSLERRFRHNTSVENFKKYAQEAAGIAILSGVCMYTAGVACSLTDVAVNGVQYNWSRVDYNEKLARFTAEDGTRLMSAADIKDAHTDALLNVSFMSIQAGPTVIDLVHKMGGGSVQLGLKRFRMEMRKGEMDGRKQDAASMLLGAEGSEDEDIQLELTHALDAR